MRPLILVSNDDGIQAEGLQVLARAVSGLGRIVVVAPDRQQSASSHSLTLHRPLRIVKEGHNRYSVDGTPTDCILLAVHEILGRKPDLVVSGINLGANLGDDVHYSGTVSAAIEGGIFGVPSVAFSLAVFNARRPIWTGAALYARKIARYLLEKPVPPGSVLNVNIPNVPRDRIRGPVFTRLGKRN